jgi:hypothetical protein
VGLAVAIGALAATDSGSSDRLAWTIAGLATTAVAVAAVAGSSAPAHVGVALLAAELLLRRDSTLLLAPIYGAGLVVVEELVWRSIELARLDAVGAGVNAARAVSVAILAAVGMAAAAVCALAATAAPGRSIVSTAAGALAITAVFAAVTRHARCELGAVARAYRAPAAEADRETQAERQAQAERDGGARPAS